MTKTLRAKVLIYKIKGGVYPSEQQGLAVLVTKPQGQPQTSAWKQLLENEELIDPWGTPYQYKYPSVRNPLDFDLYSFGPDKTGGTEDDIYSMPIKIAGP